MACIQEDIPGTWDILHVPSNNKVGTPHGARKGSRLIEGALRSMGETKSDANVVSGYDSNEVS